MYFNQIRRLDADTGFALWMVPWPILINHQPQHSFLVFIVYILVLPAHREPPLLGEFQEEDLPTKQPTKQILGQLWDSSSFSYFLWLMLCFSAVDWSVYSSVSDWWNLTSRHVSSATPVLPACLETLKNLQYNTIQWQLHKLVVTEWKSLQLRGFLATHSLNCTSPVTTFPVYSVLYFHNDPQPFIYPEQIKKQGKNNWFLAALSCVYSRCSLYLTIRMFWHHIVMCELDAVTTGAVNHLVVQLFKMYWHHHYNSTFAYCDSEGVLYYLYEPNNIRAGLNCRVAHSDQFS